MPWGRGEADVMDAVRRHFRPEFINRIDEIIAFHPLDRVHMKRWICAVDDGGRIGGVRAGYASDLALLVAGLPLGLQTWRRHVILDWYIRWGTQDDERGAPLRVMRWWPIPKLLRGIRRRVATALRRPQINEVPRL